MLHLRSVPLLQQVAVGCRGDSILLEWWISCGGLHVRLREAGAAVFRGRRGAPRIARGEAGARVLG